MKTTELKKMIKDSVKEAIQEELKDILLEAIKSPKPIITSSPVMESQMSNSNIAKSQMSPTDQRAAYEDVLNSTGNQMFTSQNAQGFSPNPSMDTANGSLPAGEVNMSQIMGLMSQK
tara:strand:+ start:382 stop:732 length:351 start_codon:yes stop_codon:yes gene_type:complete